MKPTTLTNNNLTEEVVEHNERRRVASSSSPSDDFTPEGGCDSPNISNYVIEKPCDFKEFMDIEQLETPSHFKISYLIEKLEAAEIVAQKGHLITSEELSMFVDVKPSAITAKGDRFTWRNWIVSRVRREGAQLLWQLENIDS